MRTTKTQTTIESLSLLTWLESGRTDLYNAPALNLIWRLAMNAIALRPFAWYPETDGSIVALTRHAETNAIACYRISRQPASL